MSVNTKRLRVVLIVNASFSAINGIFLLFFSELAELMHANPVSLKTVGAGLLLFGISVALVTSSKVLSRVQVIIIVIQDVLWVFGSICVILMQSWNLSVLAYWLIAFTAVVVGSFAWLQKYYLNRII